MCQWTSQIEKAPNLEILSMIKSRSHIELFKKIGASDMYKGNLRTEYEHVVDPFSGPYDKIQTNEQCEQRRDKENRVDEK
jgi:hypothetical protein